MRQQFAFYKSFDDVYQDLSDSQKIEFMNTLLDVQFLRIKTEDVTFKDVILKHIWNAQKHSLEKSINGYLESQKNTKVKSPFLGCYDDSFLPLRIPSEGVRKEEEEEEEEKGEGEGEGKTEIESKGKEEKKPTLKNQIKTKLSEYQNINLNAFNEWMDYKKYKAIGAVTKVLNFLSNYDLNTQQQIVDRSMMNNYAGLFPPKENSATKPQAKSFQQQDREARDASIDFSLQNNIYDIIDERESNASDHLQGVICE